MATLVVFSILVSYVPFSLFIARCHGNQKKEFGLKRPKNVKKHFLHIHISNYMPILILIFISWNIIARRE